MDIPDSEKRTEQLKDAIRSGRVTAGGLKRRLRAVIDAELSKDSREIDAGFVAACDGLLAELSGGPSPREAGYYDRQRALMLAGLRARGSGKRPWLRAAAVTAAAVLAVVLLGTVSFRMSWFTLHSTPDGQEYRIDGGRVSVQSVAQAIARRQPGSSYRTESAEEIESFLGFSLEGAVPAVEGWHAETYSADILEKEIRLDILLGRDGQAGGPLHYVIRWITDFGYLFEASHPQGEGEYVTVGGSSVFKSAEDGAASYTWSRGMDVFELRGEAADEVIGAFLSLNPVKEEPVTEEMLKKLIEKNYPFRSFSSDRIEEAENFLGFSLNGVLPVPEGWACESLSVAVFQNEVNLHGRLRSLERYDADLSYTVFWVLDPSEMHATIEQDEEGEYMTVGGRTVYRTTNYGNIGYVWFGKNVFYTLHGEPETDELIGLFVNPGAATAGRADEAAVSGAGPAGPVKMTETESRDEAESALGLSLQDYLPPTEDLEAEKYTVELERGKKTFRAELRDSLRGGAELIYQVTWVPDYEGFREIFLTRDQTGRYRWVTGWLVYRTAKDGNVSCTWYRGPAVLTLSGPSADEWITLFANVAVKEKETEEEEYTEEEEPLPPRIPEEPVPDTDRVTGISRAALAVPFARHGMFSGIITDDLSEVEEYLGFSPEPALPRAEGWETETYTVRLHDSLIILRAEMKNPERDQETLAYSIEWNLGDDYLLDRIDRMKQSGESLLISGRRVYRSANLKKITYVWADGFSVYQLSGTSADEVIGRFVNPGGAAGNEENGEEFYQ